MEGITRTSATNGHRRPWPRPVRTEGRSGATWRWVSLGEVGLVAVVVVLDLAIPTFVVLTLMGLSLLIRRQGPGSLALRRPRRPWSMAGTMLLLAAGWTLLDVGLLKPIQDHLTGARQDMSQFTSLEGNLGMLLTWLVLAWVVAAVGETLAFVGFVRTRVTDVAGAGRFGVWVAVLVSSVLLGLLHTEYGVVGVVVSTVDGLFYNVLRSRYGTLWAPILAHGFIDTIGLVTVFLVGPVYGLW